MASRFRQVLGIISACAGLTGITACDPPPPPAPVLTVTTTSDTDDVSPGDGICETASGGGSCSLRAAVQEANALGRASIVLPAGTYRGRDLTVTGDVTVEASDTTGARLGSQWVTVASGGRLEVDGLYSFDVPGARFIVDGTFIGRHLSLVGLESSGQLLVRSGGSAALENSLLAHVYGPVRTVTNQGSLLLSHVTLLSWLDINQPTVALSNSGQVHAAGSILQSCTGGAPTSLGYNTAADTSCSLTASGDQESVLPDYSIDLNAPVSYQLAATSPLVDAIPAGAVGCGTNVTDDRAGAPRPADGNGDGTTACDIGASELQPAN